MRLTPKAQAHSFILTRSRNVRKDAKKFSDFPKIYIKAETSMWCAGFGTNNMIKKRYKIIIFDSFYKQTAVNQSSTAVS